MPHFRNTPPVNIVDQAEFQLGLEIHALPLDRLAAPGNFLVRLVIDEQNLEPEPGEPFAEVFRVQIAKLAIPEMAVSPWTGERAGFGDLRQMLGGSPDGKVVMKPLALDTGQPMRWRTMRRGLMDDGTIAPTDAGLFTPGLLTGRRTPQGYFMAFTQS